MQELDEYGKTRAHVTTVVSTVKIFRLACLLTWFPEPLRCPVDDILRADELAGLREGFGCSCFRSALLATETRPCAEAACSRREV